MRIRRRFHSALLVVTTALFCWSSTEAQQTVNQPIITFDQIHPMLQNTDSVPMVQVFTSGLVKINRRAGSIKPGLYEHMLHPDELAQLVMLAEDTGIVNADPTLVSQAESGQLQGSADPTTTILRFNRIQGSEQLVDGESEVPAQVQTVEMDDVQVNTGRHSEISGMMALQELHKKMIELYSQAGV